MQLKLYQVDAFTNQLFKGNPAAVVPLENWLTTEQMQLIALENNLSETAFFVPEKDGYGLRWFTPAVEVDLCGHATLATAHVLFQHLNYAKERIAFYTKSGRLTVTRQGDGYAMNFPADKVQATSMPDYLEAALGTKVLEFHRGKDDFMAVIESETALASLQPDFRQIAQLDARGLLVTAKGETVDFVSRCFFPQSGIDEDPVTGSAHTTLTPYWAAKLGNETLTARQISTRSGTLTCILKGERVELQGQAVTYLEGMLRLEN